MKTITIAEANASHPRHDCGTIVELQDGRFMIAWMQYIGGELIGHDHAPCNIASMTSSDGGKTWKDHRILVERDPDDINVYFPALMRLAAGDILFFYLRYHQLEPDTPLNASGCLCRSRDEGMTFSPPITPNILRKTNLLGRTLTQLSCGRVMLPLEKVLGHWCGTTDHSHAGFCYSDDDGKTWSISPSWIDLPLRGAEEAHVAELKDGRLLMVLRTQIGAVFQSQSSDRGLTWSKPQTTGLCAPESLPCLIRLPGTGDLLLIWNHSQYDPRFDHFGKRTPLSTAISRNDGCSWENIKNIETDPAWEFTNPTCHVTSRGQVIITYVASPMDNPDPPGRLGRSRMSLKATIGDVEEFYRPD